MPAWVEPRTWTDILSDASHADADIRENQQALKDPPSANYESNEGSNYVSSGSAWQNVDSVGNDFTLSITTTGGDVVLGLTGNFLGSSGSSYVDISVDGTRIVNQSAGGLLLINAALGVRTGQLVHIIQGLSAGSHTFILQWAAAAGTITLYAGAGTANYDVHPQFWVRELT